MSNNFLSPTFEIKYKSLAMEFINQKLKNTYSQMFKELRPLDIEETCNLISDICSKNPDLWDLSEDTDGTVHDEYFNTMILFIETLH